MADPYAARTAAAAGDRPVPDPPVRASLTALGGAVVAGLGDLAAADLTAARFVAVSRADDGLLPPLASISPALAVALLCEPGETGGEASSALAALEAVVGASVPILLLKTGPVAGPAGAGGAVEVPDQSLIAAVEAALAGEISWEADPDFGYEVAAGLPDSLAGVADAFCPRLVYAAADRVYEHADLVVAYKRAWHEKLSGIDGLPSEILAAAGWPIEPTGQAWKD